MKRTPNTINAHRLTHWVEGRQTFVVHRLFEALLSRCCARILADTYALADIKLTDVKWTPALYPVH
jgi:predicted DsbA family dithiol-disulfide isomerase